MTNIERIVSAHLAHYDELYPDIDPAKVRRKSSHPIINCKTCGIEVPNRTSRTKYCPDCAVMNKRNLARKYYKRTA